MTRSQKLRVKRWIMRELDRSLSKLPSSQDLTCPVVTPSGSSTKAT